MSKDVEKAPEKSRECSYCGEVARPMHEGVPICPVCFTEYDACEWCGIGAAFETGALPSEMIGGRKWHPDCARQARARKWFDSQVPA